MYSLELYWIITVISAITGCVSISAFASLVGTPAGITSSTIELKISAITAGIKMYESIIKKKKKQHDKIVLLAKSKLKRIEVLISKPLIDSNISHYNVLKGFYDTKEKN